MSNHQCDTTVAIVRGGELVRTSMYMGPSCSVEVSRNVQLLMLDHLYGHRMGANVSRIEGQQDCKSVGS